MSASVRWIADRERRRRREGRLAHGLGSAGTLVLGIILMIAIGLALRGGLPTERPTLVALAGGAENATPEQLTGSAADVLDDSTKAGGGGYRFEIIQTSTMVAKPGGPRIPIPDPVTRGTLRMDDTYFLSAIIEQGVVRSGGFWSQMRAGPAEGAKPDWTGAPILYEALVRDGERWRNDGDGWYRAQALPGIGLDPETAGLLPGLLRKATAAADLPIGDPKVDPRAARNLEASAKVADIPGVVASEGAAFTKLTDKVAYGFDDTGRLISMHVTALNMNMTDFDLVIETRIEVAYDAIVGLPEPKPALGADGSN